MSTSLNKKLFYKEEMIKFISNNFFIDLTEEELDLSLAEIGIESIDAFKIIYFLKDTLKIDIKNSEINQENFLNINRIINFCSKKGE